jgi:peptide deformylase
MPLLPIVQVGAPVLRRRALPVPLEELATPRIRDLIDSMRETMRAAPGVGLAAPQIGEPLQLVVIEDPPELHARLTRDELADRERAPVPFHVLVNPTLTLEPGPDVNAFEGCLSFSGYVMVVPRARRVRVDALDEHGAPFSREATGWYARILQHEVDHLRGTVCCDRMLPRTLTTVENYAREWSAMPVEDVLDSLAAG